MKEDINLASTANVEAKVKKTLDPMLLIFGGVFLFSVILIATSLILSAVLGSIQNQATSLKSVISKSTKKQKIVILSDRLGAIRNILAERSLVSPTSSKVIEAIPDSFEINNLSANSENITVVISSSSLSDYARFLQETLPAFTKKNATSLSNVTIENFTVRDEEYEMNLKFKVSLNVK